MKDQSLSELNKKLGGKTKEPWTHEKKSQITLRGPGMVDLDLCLCLNILFFIFIFTKCWYRKGYK